MINQNRGMIGKKSMITIAVILVLSVGLVLLINPADKLKFANDLRVRADINNLLNAISACQIDSVGSLAKCGFGELKTNTAYLISTGKEKFPGYENRDLCSLVAKAYLNKLPINTGLNGWVAEGNVDSGAEKKSKYYADCQSAKDYYTAYALFINKDKRVSISGVSRVGDEATFTVISN
jgi:hypothetical protein